MSLGTEPTGAAPTSLIEGTGNTVARLSQALASKQVSSVELTQHYLQRIAAQNAHINAFITVTAEQALTQAKAADASRAAGLAGPLTGIPIAHKDLFCTAGIRTSCGSRMLDNFIAPYDASVVARLQDAGAVMLGKTNMDEFAMGSSNEHSYYGNVRNPWDHNRVPGGSSGGSAAAVAAGMVPAATGTDTGGSIRQPAAFCGLTGIKPTYGRVSRYGMVAFASSFDQAGPIAWTAEDCALLLQAMAGADSRDSTSATDAVADYRAALARPLQGLRIGIAREYQHDLAAPIDAALARAREDFILAGAICKDISLPHTDLAIPAYYIIAPAECSANLARFDGVRFGHRAAAPKDIFELYCRSRAEGFGAEVQRRILTGAYVLSVGYHDAYYVQAQRVRRLIRDDFINAFHEVDVILTATTPTTAFPIGAISDPLTMYRQDIYTTTANLAGLPAITFPIGFDGALPIGGQLIGPHFGESRLLSAVHQFQQNTDWHTQRPPRQRASNARNAAGATR